VKQVIFICACCKCIRRKNPRVKNQKYCGAKACQQARKNKWQREKLQTDHDYKADKREMQQSWLARNPDYWRRYRAQNPIYCERNRKLQRERDKQISDARGQVREGDTGHLAKMDTLNQYFNHTTTGYYIYPVESNLAKKDALTVNIVPISPG